MPGSQVLLKVIHPQGKHMRTMFSDKCMVYGNEMMDRAKRGKDIFAMSSHMHFIAEKVATRFYQPEAIVRYDMYIRDRAAKVGKKYFAKRDTDVITRFFCTDSMQDSTKFKGRSNTKGNAKSTPAILLGFGAAVNTDEKRADVNKQDTSNNASSLVISASTRGPQYRVLPERIIADRSTTALPLSTTSETTREPNGDFVVKQGEHVCIRANFKVTFTVKYAMQKRKSLSIAKSLLSMPDHVAVSGACADETASLTLTWANSTYSMTIAFNLQTKERKKRREEAEVKLYGWGTASAAFSFDTRDEAIFHHPLHPGKHTMTTLPSENYFFTPRNRSFSCTSRQRLLLNEYNHNGSVVKDDVIHVTLDFDSMRVQAFDMPPSGEFSESASCDTDIYNNLPHQNVVPIIVAACLAGIIMIIIVAYFITKHLGQNPYKAMD